MIWIIWRWLVVDVISGDTTLLLDWILRQKRLFHFFILEDTIGLIILSGQKRGTIVTGITPIGRATCIRLDLNDMRYPEKDSIRSTRRFWLKTQLHPPIGDSRLE